MARGDWSEKDPIGMRRRPTSVQQRRDAAMLWRDLIVVAMILAVVVAVIWLSVNG